MNIEAISPDLRMRLREPDRAAIATIARAIATPHRAPPNLTDTVRAALAIATRSLQANTGAA